MEGGSGECNLIPPHNNNRNNNLHISRTWRLRRGWKSTKATTWTRSLSPVSPAPGRAAPAWAGRSPCSACPCDAAPYTWEMNKFKSDSRPTTESVGLFVPFFVSSINFDIIYGLQKRYKNRNFSPLFDFLEGSVFVPYPRYEKLSRRYILGPY